MAVNNNRDRNNNTRQRTRTVFVPVGGGGSNIKTEELSVSENGTYEAGEDKAYSKVTVKVTEPLGTVKIANGIKLSFSSFITVPEWMDFEGVTDMELMFENCSSLTTIPKLDTSQVTNMKAMFKNCSSLTTIPKLDTSQVTNMEDMFGNCSSLTTIPKLDTSQVTNMDYMFFSCFNLQSIPELDTSQVTTMSRMFCDCFSITDLGGFIGLKCNLELEPFLGSYPLTHDSLMNVINKAADVTASPATLTLGSTNLAKLSDEEKGIATTKGWTLA